MRRLFTLAAGGIVMLTIALGAAAPAAADPAAADPAAAPAAQVQAAAEQYLQARAAAVLPSAAASPLPACLPPGSPLLATQQLVAVGKVAFWRSWHERPVAVSCSVTDATATIDQTGAAATASAYALATITLANGRGSTRQEQEGIRHQLTLSLVGGRWLVTADQYADTAELAYLKAVAAPAATVRSTRQRLVEKARTEQLSALLTQVPLTPAPAEVAPRYVTTFTYDRAAAVAYADRWTTESDSTGISHNGSRYNPAYYDYASNGGPGDCTPYASQCLRAGGYPYLTSWFYDVAHPFSSAPAWYNNNPQRTYLTGRYLDKVSTVSDLQKGDLIYYDWNSDGYLDHTAVYVGIYNGVRCVDAHTSDHRHHAWNLGAGKSYFYSVRDSIHWPIPNP
jgi:hypothetical protein